MHQSTQLNKYICNLPKFLKKLISVVIVKRVYKKVSTLIQDILAAPIKGNSWSRKRGEVDALHNISYRYNADNTRVALKSARNFV